MAADNPYQSPTEESRRDERSPPAGGLRWRLSRLMIGVWSPFSIATAARHASMRAALIASTTTCSLYFGAFWGVVAGCGAEPFQGWADCCEAIGFLTAVFSAFFVSPYLLAISPLLLACRVRRLDEYRLRQLLIAPLAFRLPYLLLLAALFLELARDPSFEFMEIEKPYFVSDDYAAGLAKAGLALGSIFLVLLFALPIKNRIIRQNAKP